MMFYKGSQVFFHFFMILLYVFGGALETKKNKKRTSLRNNYQMCLDNFNIYEHKIIRTKESLAMGAKFLTYFNVTSREECLKFCCDTESCDVFTLEEKKRGSCYLFQCGSLHDFKCNFTNHANYSSATRTNYDTQRNSRLEEEIRISQQEYELKSLRDLADPPPAVYSFTEPSIKLIATLPPKLSLTTSPPMKQECSRNQYKCRSSGDCIAVYNVCDGIPQCADGSDEEAELVCPTEKPTVPPTIMQGPQPPLPPLPVDIVKYPQMLDQRKLLAPLYARVQEVNSGDLPNLSHRMIPQQQSVLYSAQQMDIPQMHKGFDYQWNYQTMYDQNKDGYDTFREPYNLNLPEQDQPRIFNRKGSSVIREKESDGAYLDVTRSYSSHIALPNRGSWQSNQWRTYPPPSSSPISNVQRKQIIEVEKTVITTPPCDTSHEQKDAPQLGKETEKVIQKEDTRMVHEKEVSQKSKQNTLKTETPNFSHIQPKESKVVEHKSVIVIKDHREHGRNTLVAEHLKQANENEVLKPRGAVISLALGLTITAITATLIACRLRVVRRRGRRHGPFAHDADYLVNGMYL